MDSRKTGQGARYREIAAELIARIHDGRLPPDESLPAEQTLADLFGVARGTIRRAIAVVDAEAGMLRRKGSRWIVRRVRHAQDVTQLTSFGQWALESGQSVSALTVSRRRGRATPKERYLLGLRPESPVLRIVKIERLGGQAVMIKRTTYPERLVTAIESVPEDARSIMEHLTPRIGVRLAYAESEISALVADARDARMLEIEVGDPLLRVTRALRDENGRAFEYSDDRYRADGMALRIQSANR